MLRRPHVHRHGGWSSLEEVCTHPRADRGQADGHGNMADGLSDGHRDIANGDQADGYRHSAFR